MRFRVRAELRVHWREWIALGLLVGVLLGVIIAAAAGARRTSSAYPRLLAEARAADLTVDVFADEDVDIADFPWAEVAQLPDVAMSGSYAGLIMAGEQDGTIAPLAINTIASDGVRFYGFDRPRMAEGHLPDAERHDQVFLNTAAAGELGLGTGDELLVRVPRFQDIQRFPGEPSFDEIIAADKQGPPVGVTARLTVSGIGTLLDDVASDEAGTSAVAIVPPGFVEHYGAVTTYEILALDLDSGADPAGVTEAIRELGGDRYRVQVKDQADVTRPVQRAFRPYVAALITFALLAATAGMAIAGQAISRQAASDAADAPTLRALGVSRLGLLVLAAVRALPTAAIAAFAAAGVAVAGSAVFPIGLARTAEPSPGLDVDAAALGAGVAAVFALSVGWYLFADVLERHRQRGSRLTPRPSRLLDVVTAMGAPPSGVAGVSMAIRAGAGRGRVPTRSTLTGAAVAVISLLAVLTFGSGLDRLVQSPERYGWTWDVALGSHGGYISLDESAVDRRLRSDEGVAGWTFVSYGAVSAGELEVPALGFKPAHGAVQPPVLEGRGLVAPGEVLLGSTTLRNLDLGVGDSVRVGQGASARTLQIVGRAIFPAIGFHDAERPGLGEGAALLFDDFSAMTPGARLNAALVDLVPGAAGARSGEALRRYYRGIETEEPGVLGPMRPGDITAYGDLRWLPIGLAGLLAAVALATLAHTLAVSVRRRRRDLAVLKTLGFTRRQARTCVAWQATVFAVLATAVGLPLGVAGGRVLWRLFASRLGIDPSPLTPVAATIAVLPIAVLAATLLAALPARSAARTHPALLLRGD